MRETGTTAPAWIGGYRKPLLAKHEDLLRKLTTAKGHITLAEIPREARRAQHRGRLPDDDLVDAAQAWPVTQRNSLRAAEQDRADVAEHRRMWRMWQRYMDPDRFMFIDA